LESERFTKPPINIKTQTRVYFFYIYIINENQDSAISVRDFFNKIKSDLQNEDFDCNLILIIRTVLDLILRTKIINLDSGNIKKILHEPEQVDSTCRKCNIMGGHKSKKTRKKFERFD